MIDGYVVCTTPRSGSTLLCSLLEATGQAGHPWSFYHKSEFMQEWAEVWGLPKAGTVSSNEYNAAYLRATIAAGRGVTALFGMRLQQAYLAPLAAMLARLHPTARSDSERFKLAFGSLRYVHLTRDDKVAQAVSLVKARQSGLWHRNADGSERERSGPAAEPVYDADAIRAEVTNVTRADLAWSQWFKNERIEPLRITYETFAQRPVATIFDICAVFGVELPDIATVTPMVAKLADGVNLEWAARYRTDNPTT